MRVKRERDEIQAEVEASFQKHVDFACGEIRKYLLRIAKIAHKRMPKRRIQFIDAMGSYGFIVSRPNKDEDGRSRYTDWVKNMPDMLVLRCKTLRLLSDAEEWYGRVTRNPNITIEDIDLPPRMKVQK